MKKFLLIFLMFLPAVSFAEEESSTICVEGLSGYAAYHHEDDEFDSDKISSSVVIQIFGTNEVRVLGWPRGACQLVNEFIVCSSGDTIETYFIADDGTVYYTRMVSSELLRSAKAMVGRIGEC